MKITILGSSSFVSSPDRFGPGYLLEVGDKKILVEAGSGTQIRLAQLGVNIRDLDYIFITHFHPDHTADLPSFFLRYSMVVRADPKLDGKLIIFGPKGITEFIKGALEISGLKFLADKPGARVKEFSMLEADSFVVKAFKTQHMGVVSQGYRFEIGEKLVVFTGDTAYYPDIIKDCQNADLVFIDSSLNQTEEAQAHLNTEAVGKICQQAGVEKVVLSHILEYNRGRDMASEVRQYYDGEIVTAQDLLEFNL